MDTFVIAIDGPAASGKSTVASQLAAHLDIAHINSGEFYRAATLAVLQSGLPLDDEAGIMADLEQRDWHFPIREGRSLIKLDGMILGDELKSDHVNAAVSKVSVLPRLREWVVFHLREFAQVGRIVMEGRDIGTVVFPDTPYKLFITASEEVRQQRRQAQGQTDQVRQRDKQDQTRKTAPLKMAEGATLIDTSELSIPEVMSLVVEVLKNSGLEIGEA